MSRKKLTAKVARRRKPEPLDPRLQRVFDVIDERWNAEEIGDWESFCEAFLDKLSPTGDGLKAMIAALLKDSCENTVGVSNALDRMLEIAESEHCAHCTCCQAKAKRQSAQEATVQ